MQLHPVILLLGGIGSAGRRKLTGWLFKELICLLLSLGKRLYGRGCFRGTTLANQIWMISLAGQPFLHGLEWLICMDGVGLFLKHGLMINLLFRRKSFLGCMLLACSQCFRPFLVTSQLH
uniref:Uncharacterized protein n=1 Tax=Arundo donax TaxID=35708 RepID=A0A0A9EBV2_ARUDO